MKFPAGLKYTKDHEWVSFNKDMATIGVTHYAIEQLGDIVHLDLPELDEQFDSGSSFGTIESTKTVSDLYAPVAGTVVEINDDLANHLEALHEDPYEEGWLIRIKVGKEIDESELMSETEYEEFIAEQE